MKNWLRHVMSRIPPWVWKVIIVGEVIGTAIPLWLSRDMLNQWAGLASWFSGLGAFAAAAVAIWVVFLQADRQRHLADQRTAEVTSVLAAAYLPAIQTVSLSAGWLATEIFKLHDDNNMGVLRRALSGELKPYILVPKILTEAMPHLVMLDPKAAALLGRLIVRTYTFNEEAEAGGFGKLHEDWELFHMEVSAISDLAVLTRRRFMHLAGTLQHDT